MVMNSEGEGFAREVTEEAGSDTEEVDHSKGYYADDDVTPVVEKIAPSLPVINITAVNVTSTNSDVSKEMQELAATSEEGEKTPPVPPRMKKKKVVELRCFEVRWFHRRKTVDTKWTPFQGYDSIRLEIFWRVKNGVDLDPQTSARVNNQKTKRNCSVVVLDGLYRATEDLSYIHSIYWKDDEMEIRRGTWFIAESMQPINNDMAEPIEKHHLHHFRLQTIPDTPVFSEKESSKKPVLTELKLQDQYEVKWNSVIDVTLYNNSKASRLLRYITWGKGTVLKRGYEEADWDDGKRVISHLVFVVHGIGQKGYENLIAKNTDQVRDAIYSCMDKHYSDEKTRPMVLPVEWRAALVLDGGLTDYVTLPKMSTMRSALNSTAMDIMYYQSPLYRREIMAGLVRSLNTVYGLFMENYPNFDGPISLFAHSLGSVMCYDILTSWSPLVLYDKYVADAIEAEVKSSESAHISILNGFQEARLKLLDAFGGFQNVFLSEDEQLKFKVTNLFCIGSPLAVFLIMRGATTVCPDYIKVKRIYNIFHPYDPVAYRLEPLVHSQYRFIRPVKLFTSIDLRSLRDYDLMAPEIHKSYIKKMKAREKREKEKDKGIEEKEAKEREEMEEEDECDSDESSALRPNSSCSSPRSITPPPVSLDGQEKKSWWKFGSGRKDAIEIGKELEEAKLTDAEKIIDEIPLENRLKYRMDFQIQPQITDRSYWSVLKSHFAYWTNLDIAAFIVNQMYRKDEKPVESPSQK